MLLASAVPNGERDKRVRGIEIAFIDDDDELRLSGRPRKTVSTDNRTSDTEQTFRIPAVAFSVDIVFFTVIVCFRRISFGKSVGTTASRVRNSERYR